MSAKSNLMSYAYLRQSANATAARSDRELNGFAKRFSQAIDCLLKLPYWVDRDSGQGPDLYRGWAETAYVGAGHSFAALHQLFRCGFYLETHVLHRHLVEVLVQLVYFAGHPDKVMGHFIPPELQDRNATPAIKLKGGMPKRKALNFKTMFEYAVPGYYDRYYRMLSEFAHGGAGSGMFRHDHLTGKVTLGCQYSDRHAGSMSNFATALLYGFIRRFPDVFPNWKATEAEPIYSEALNALDEIIQAQWAEHPESREWLSSIGKLIGWTATAVDEPA